MLMDEAVEPRTVFDLNDPEYSADLACLHVAFVMKT